MRELRQDPLTGRWMVLCDDRMGFHVPPRAHEPSEAACPFCPEGDAWQTPSLDQVGHARAWPHRAPVLRVEEGGEAIAPGRRPGLGAHEVLVASDVHDAVHALPTAAAVDVMRLAARRLLDLRGDRRLPTQGWSRRVRPGGHGRDTVSAFPALPGSAPPVARRAVADALEAAHRDGRELGQVGDVHVWCSLAPQRPFEVRLAWLGRGEVDRALIELAVALRAVEGVLWDEVGPHGHDAWLRRGPSGDAPALLSGCVEVAPVSTIDHSPLVGVLPAHAATPEVIAGPLRERFRTMLCHDAAWLGEER